MKTAKPAPSAQIRTAREKLGITQSEAATRIGYSLSAYQKFELGKRTPPKRWIDAILKNLTA